MESLSRKAEVLRGAISNNLQIAPKRRAAVTQTAPSDGLIPTRKAKIERNIVKLVQAFPLAFSTEPEQIKPLGIGIKQQIYPRCNLSHREVGAALRRYTSRVAYLYAIINGAVRVDPDGKASGSVTAKEAAYAAEQIQKILAKAAGHPKNKIKLNAPLPCNTRPRPAISDALKSGSRRLGLADSTQTAATGRVRTGSGDTRPLEPARP
jgi:ProP effector